MTMINAYTQEYIRLINSVALSPSEKLRLAELLIEKANEKGIFTKKHAAAAGIAVVVAAGVFIPYMLNRTK